MGVGDSSWTQAVAFLMSSSCWASGWPLTSHDCPQNPPSPETPRSCLFLLCSNFQIPRGCCSPVKGPNGVWNLLRGRQPPPPRSVPPAAFALLLTFQPVRSSESLRSSYLAPRLHVTGALISKNIAAWSMSVKLYTQKPWGVSILDAINIFMPRWEIGRDVHKLKKYLKSKQNCRRRRHRADLQFCCICLCCVCAHEYVLRCVLVQVMHF